MILIEHLLCYYSYSINAHVVFVLRIFTIGQVKMNEEYIHYVLRIAKCGLEVSHNCKSFVGNVYMVVSDTSYMIDCDPLLW